MTNTGTGNELLNTTDLGYPVHAAFRVNFVLPGCNGCDLVVNYLGARFENSRVHDATTASYDFFEFPSLTPASATSFETSYVSTLNSVELNTRVRQWERFAPLSGLRYIGLCDEFDRSPSPGGLAATSSSARSKFIDVIDSKASSVAETGRVRSIWSSSSNGSYYILGGGVITNGGRVLG